MTARIITQRMLAWVPALIGFTSVVAQIILMRELVVVFHGNEMSLGVILASWLFWTALGSGMLGKSLARVPSPAAAVAVLQAAISLVMPLAVLVVRFAGHTFGVSRGELLGPGPMFLTSQLALGAVCLLSGSLYAAGSRLYMHVRGWATAGATSAVYVLEAVGSAAGGIIAGVLLIRYLNSIEVALILSALNLATALTLAVARPGVRGAAVAAVIVLYAAVVVPLGGRAIDTASLQHMWRGFELLESRSSIYGNLVVLSTEGTRSVCANGVKVVTVPDAPAAEEAVHYALLQHPSPRRLLLIGGGVGGALAEALKHPTLEHAAYVELDPTILELGRLYFTATWTPVAADPRVAAHHTDGRLFLSRTDQRFDVIIVNLPDPVTAQLNRFYTREFFAEAAGRLNPGGVLSIHATGAENYISAELEQFLRCINKTLEEVFDQVVAVPGATIHFFAAGSDGALTADPDVLISRLRDRGIDTRYVRGYYIPFRMSPDRMAELEERIKPAPGTPVNRDLAPVAYYFNVVLWSTHFGDWFRGAIQAPGRVGFVAVILALCVAAASYAGFSVWRIRGRRRLRAGTIGCVAAMGFTQIGVEVMILLAFQSVYGYVYHQLAVLIAMFMVGMTVGGALSLRRHAPGSAAAATRRDLGVLLKLQVAAVLAAPALYAFVAASTAVSHPAGVFAVSNLLFPAAAALSGALGGYQFPLASRVYFGTPGASHDVGGLGAVYAVDLAGACAGAVAIGAYFIPVFGFLQTALILVVVNLAPTLVVATSMPAARSSSSID